MKAVLDSCVWIKLALPETDSNKAAALKDDFAKQLHEFVAPDVLPVEIAHAISRAQRKGILKPPEGTQAFTDILQVLPQLHDSLTLLPRAFEISSNHRIGVYDCLYLALAEREQVPLITSDQKLLAQKGFSVIDLAGIP